jgi:RNA polymerase sigma-70 factor (ECF subfamily)
MEKEEILQSAIAGDINAFQTLYARFQSQLKSYLYRLLTNRDDVEDLAEGIF